MSLQRKINKVHLARKPQAFAYSDKLHRAITRSAPKEVVNKPDKGLEDGACNRTACQRPLADEIEHQFMDGNFTGGPRLFYCADCAREFDRWDFRSGDMVRIKRELKGRFA